MSGCFHPVGGLFSTLQTTPIYSESCLADAVENAVRYKDFYVIVQVKLNTGRRFDIIGQIRRGRSLCVRGPFAKNLLARRQLTNSVCRKHARGSMNRGKENPMAPVRTPRAFNARDLITARYKS
jgi:hypothetical protein